MELSFPGTFAPESGNDVKLSLPEGKMTWNFCSPCPKIVVATNCTHGEQGSQDVIPCTRPVEACRPSEAILGRSQSSWKANFRLISLSCGNIARVPSALGQYSAGILPACLRHLGNIPATEGN